MQGMLGSLSPIKESSCTPSLVEPTSRYTTLFSPDPLPVCLAFPSPFTGVSSLPHLGDELQGAARPSQLHLRGSNVHGVRAYNRGLAAVNAVEGAGCPASGADGRDAGSVVCYDISFNSLWRWFDETAKRNRMGGDWRMVMEGLRRGKRRRVGEAREEAR